MPRSASPPLTDLLSALTASELAELDGLLHELGPQTFKGFATSARPTYQWWRHTQVIAETLEAVVAGKRKRVIIVMPPRHGKSEGVTRLGSAYYLRRHPDRWVGVNTYSADLSHIMSRAAKAYYLGRAEERVLDVEAVKHWETPYGGGMWAAGVGGPITGKGFDLGIIDDPLKNAEEAGSPVIRNKQREWWDSTFYTRAEPGAAIVVIATRWHEQDLIGYLLEKEESEPEHWHIVHLAGLAEPPQRYPETCTLATDWRAMGEALCPEKYTAEDLKNIQRRIGPYFFAALYQQRPQPREGGLFKRAWFGEPVEAVPAELQCVRAWDQAATAGAGDYSAGVKIGRTKEGMFYVLDVMRGQWDTGTRDTIIKQTASTDGKACAVEGEQEPGAAGKSASVAFVRMLAGYRARTTAASGDKTVRAGPFASQCEVGNVRLVKGPWNRDYLDELCAFPTGSHDDQVDASALAFNRLHLGPQPSKAGPTSLTRESPWTIR